MNTYCFFVTLIFEVVLVVVDLTMVSFFKLSGLEEVSFLVVSITVFVDESVFTESDVAEPLPLQAARDVAMANIRKPILNEFFMIMVLSN
jgi:hypothetical protein